eukprot:7552736-Alexandrium_andersonii.AAC.1
MPACPSRSGAAEACQSPQQVAPTCDPGCASHGGAGATRPPWRGGSEGPAGGRTGDNQHTMQ